MKNNKLLKILVCMLMLGIGGRSLLAEAATHTHTAECGLAVAHVHKGSQKVKGGCYQGSSTQITCGTGVYEGRTTSSTSNQGQSGSMTGWANCNGCGQDFSVGSASWGPTGGSGNIPGTGTVCTHKVTGYELSCGYAEGQLADCYFHTHNGVPTVKGGCYKGAKQTSAECGAKFKSIIEVEGASGYGYCGSCGSNNIRYNSYIITYECGHTKNASMSYCSVHTTNIPAYIENWHSQQKASKCSTKTTTYALSCGLSDTTLYDGNGNAAELICNKKINSITPKSKTQTLVK